MNETAKRRLYLYSTVGITILLIASLVAIVVGYNGKPGDSYQPPITQNPGTDEEVEDDDTVVVQDVRFSLPIKGEYTVFRHYWHMDLTDDEKDMAIVNSKTTDGITIVDKNNAAFDVFSSIPGTVKEVSTGDRGIYVIIESDNVIIELHSIKDVQVSVGDKVTTNTKIGTATLNALDEEAEINVYLITKVKDSNTFKRSNPLNYVNKKMSEISYIK